MYTNPTIAATSQFIAPYDLTPDAANTYTNPTIAATSQFIAPYDLTPDAAKPNSQVTTAPDFFINPYTPNVRTPLIVLPIIRSDSNLNTNISPSSATVRLLGGAANIVGSQLGIPQVAQISQTLIGQFANDSLSGTYVTLPLQRLQSFPAVKYSDFRSRFPVQGNKITDSVAEATSYQNTEFFKKPNQAIALATSRRLDGTAAALNGSWKAAAYAAAAISPAGAYSVFNLDGASMTGYGYGDHDNKYAKRSDFTATSHIATTWMPGGISKLDGKTPYSGEYVATKNPLSIITAFRGDKVNVIDFGKRTMKGAYLWKPRSGNKLEKLADNLSNKLNLTQDFIKFFFTGPDLYNGVDDKTLDDIIVFRAAITSLTDGYTANWSPINMIGRADPNYHYTGFTRDVSLGFDIYATDRDELKPIYRKLNALAGFTAPTYNPASIAMEGPWMRLTIGDLYVQQPVVLTSLTYTFAVDAPWEINIEDDPRMMQVPLKIGVQCSMNMISDYLPRKGGRFYTLAKQFDGNNSIPIEGNDNWLSDTDSAPLVIPPVFETYSTGNPSNDVTSTKIISLAEALNKP